MLSGIEGSSVIVTGASRGIGKGIAKVFAQNGAKVLLVSRNGDALKATADELAVDGSEVSYIVADVSDPDALDKMAATALERHGSMDALCANAGIFPEAWAADMTAEDLDAVFAVNVRGTVLAVKSCLPAMRKAGRGRIIITSSITGQVTGYPGWSHYGASKAAQLGYMRTAAIEIARQGITINALMPGNIRTEGLEGLGEAFANEMCASIPMGRLGTVEEVGYAAMFLASDQAAFITGQTLTIDGGQTLPESHQAAQAVRGM